MMVEKRYPRVLVISGNAFTRGGSNGKALGGYFEGWDTDCLAQIYTSGETPDLPVCENYYRITDRAVLRSFFFGWEAGESVALRTVPSENSSLPSGQGQMIRRNPMTLWLRDVIWNSNRWMNQGFWSFVKEFHPEAVVLMAGNSSRLPRIAMKVAAVCHIPLIIYNTENYYFKDFNYFFGEKFGFWYPVYRRQYCRTYQKMMKCSSAEVYLNDVLSEQHFKEFGKKGTVIYNSTSLKPFESNCVVMPPQFMYAGNLGIGRHRSLMEISAALQRIDTSYCLDVFGRATESVVRELRNAPGIRYHGPVPYQRVLLEMEKSTLLFHAESFIPERIKDLNGAFSSKIADSLASGRCFVVYADESMACSQYLRKNACACVIHKQEQLEESLRELLGSEVLQEFYIQNALRVVSENHNSDKNRDTFRELILSEVNRYENLSN